MMWSSIQEVIKPGSISEALELVQAPGSRFLAGGSYLVAEQNPAISRLIDIQGLLSPELLQEETGWLVGAGITLQDLMQAKQALPVDVIRHTCPSKNIRNQRTLGGELAQARSDSDLLVYLHAAQARVELNDSGVWQSLADWEGQDLLTRIHIPPGKTLIERIALLDSTAAFVIVALQKTQENWVFCVGGLSQGLLYRKFTGAIQESDIRAFLQSVKNAFRDDHLGTAAYKEQVVANLMYEMAVTG